MTIIPQLERLHPDAASAIKMIQRSLDWLRSASPPHALTDIAAYIIAHAVETLRRSGHDAAARRILIGELADLELDQTPEPEHSATVALHATSDVVPVTVVYFSRNAVRALSPDVPESFPSPGACVRHSSRT